MFGMESISDHLIYWHAVQEKYKLRQTRRKKHKQRGVKINH